MPYPWTGAFTPEVALTHPNAVRALHEEMLHCGAEVLQVMAFYGSREKLATVGEAEHTVEINRAATRIAREVAGDRALCHSSSWFVGFVCRPTATKPLAG